jgi:ABC-type polysaccharide/polyol phosphate transport system ATPase subunit
MHRPSETTIEVADLAKFYLIRHERATTLTQEIMGWMRHRRAEEFWALKGITFRVEPGEALGVIGRNGSGKSTLLKILAGTVAPTTGRLTVRGSVSTLIQLGAGFHPDFSGRNNVFLSAAILAIPKRVIEARFDEIVAFAELEKFIDVPIKYYSSGMLARLGFAVSIAVDPDVLLIDEVLSVGDLAFQKKCEARMYDLIGGGKTVVLVSHDIGAVEKMCARALWLDQGEVKLLGASAEVTAAYRAEAQHAA